MFSDQKMVNRAICELGRCTLAEQVDDSTTHVVSGENRRTVKVLTGISRGLWILSLDWVSGSICILQSFSFDPVEASMLTERLLLASCYCIIVTELLLEVE